MLYPFMTLEDNTEIVHSEAYIENGVEKVKVCIEQPVYGGFNSAQCILPEYEWQKVEGFNEKEIASLQELIESVSHIIQLARDGSEE